MIANKVPGAAFWLPGVLLLGLLTACAPKTRQVSEQSLGAEVLLRELALDGPWRLEGKLALSDGKTSGSGRFTWDKNTGLSTVTMTAPLGQGRWQLEEQPGQVLLHSSRSGVLVGQTAKALLAQEVGWDVPWNALSFWLFGLPWQGMASSTVTTRNGKAHLRELGWDIEYSRFRETAVGMLPHKLVARQGEYSIKLIIRQWRFPGVTHHGP